MFPTNNDVTAMYTCIYDRCIRIYPFYVVLWYSQHNLQMYLYFAVLQLNVSTSVYILQCLRPSAMFSSELSFEIHTITLLSYFRSTFHAPPSSTSRFLSIPQQIAGTINGRKIECRSSINLYFIN